jgi:hypothetical protein
MRPNAVLVAAALALSGCFLHARSPSPMTSEGEWALERDAMSRRDFLYDGLKHRATATATLLTPAVREARARRLAAWLGWTPAELEERLAQERAEAAAGEELLLSLYTSEPKDNDLDAPRSIWRVAVKLEGADLVARRVTALDRNATIVELYPYIGPFDTVYRVVLPAAPAGPLAGQPFVFEVTSARGKLSLDFRKPGGPITPQEPVPPPG